MNLTSYEVVIDSLHGQQCRPTGQETGYAGVNVQQRGYIAQPTQSPSHSAHICAVRFILLLPCPLCNKMWIQGNQVCTCGKQTFKEEKMGLQSQSSDHCLLLWKSYSEDKINVSCDSFVISFALNHSLST